MKLLNAILILGGLHFATHINAASITLDLDSDKDISTIYVTTSTHTARFIEASDIDDIGRLCAASNPQGLPEDSAKWAENLIVRRNGGNYYSCLIVKDTADQTVAALGLGRMPSLGYEPKFTDIIDTWMNFGVIGQKSPENGYAKDNFERLENAGIATLLPIIPMSLTPEAQSEIIKLGAEVVQFFKDKNFVLPIEKTLPHDLITLLSPADLLCEKFKEVGFTLLEKEGYAGFYDKERVILHKVL